MNLDDIKITFIAESSEILQKMESTLLYLEANEATDELINELFRGFHTIKGSAGIFGYEHIVKFTHVVENYMDMVRNHVLPLEKDGIGILLECRDLISDMIEQVANDIEPNDDLKQAQWKLLNRLDELLNQQELSGLAAQEVDESLYEEMEMDKPDVSELKFPDLEVAEQPVLSEEKANHTIIQPTGTYTNGLWHISIRFFEDAFRNGFEPAALLSYLNEIGEVVNLITVHHRIPEAEAFDPESCYLGFEIDLQFDGTIEQVLEAFEFVIQDCNLFVLLPERSRQDYLELFRNFPDEKIFIGKCLHYMGSLAREESDFFRQQKHPKREQQPVNELELGEPQPEPQSFEKVSESAEIAETIEPESSESKTIEPIPTESDPIESESPQPTTETTPKKQQLKPKTFENKVIRVDANKLDNLVNLVGELVISGANIHQLSGNRQDAELMESSYHLLHLISEIRESALKLRMVQVGDTFNRFHRTVRDIGHELGKKIELTITGGDTELDKTVVEKINDPLMHIIRNAIDHGIESKQDRLACGKPEKGNLSIHAYHETGYIVIEVKDDGHGLDAQKIQRKAIEKKLISEEQQLTEEQIFNLLFTPGFSTAETITDLSGRGVGLDVVIKNIEALRGSVNVSSKIQEGTVFKVRLPLTLAIIDGFLVTVGKFYYVIPLDVVIECIEFKKEKVNSKNRDYINLRGEVLPFIRLQELFGVENSRAKRKNILIIKFAGKKIGLLVDALLGEIQTVIKPLGKVFQKLKGISGSTILGNGEIALILDIVSLIHRTIAIEAQQNTKGNLQDSGELL